ncbi:hypothetical protein CEXT_760561 [Caerostris extrusa]|uniref:Uncharacterized protein n=1 Tax=Caerostris extrusa TaxID=172846 RepID=A0AAV4VQT3_CAEEX|nr:hypothetical protein CEXT_760561 [Caerostris extrusa]
MYYSREHRREELKLRFQPPLLSHGQARIPMPSPGWQTYLVTPDNERINHKTAAKTRSNEHNAKMVRGQAVLHSVVDAHDADEVVLENIKFISH